MIERIFFAADDRYLSEGWSDVVDQSLISIQIRVEIAILVETSFCMYVHLPIESGLVVSWKFQVRVGLFDLSNILFCIM